MGFSLLNSEEIQNSHICYLRMTEVDLKVASSPCSLSFGGGGFLVVYEIGVVQSLLEQAPEIVKSASKVYGASAGSLVAAYVVCECCLGKRCIGWIILLVCISYGMICKGYC